VFACVRFSLYDSVSAANLASIDDVGDGHPADRKCIEYTGALSSHFMFAALDRCEDILSKQRYIAGSELTESDIRLFVIVVRFDEVLSGVCKRSVRIFDICVFLNGNFYLTYSHEQ